MKSPAILIASIAFKFASRSALRRELQSDIEERYAILLARFGRVTAELRTLGAVAQLVPFAIKDRYTHRVRRRRTAGGMWLELIQILRGLHRSRGVALLIIVTLGVGTAAVTVVFSIFANILPRHSPSVPNPEEIVNVTFDRTEILPRISNVHFEEIANALRDQIRLASYYNVPAHVVSSDRPAEQLEMELVTEDYFPVLQLRAITGRVLAAQDFNPSAPPVVVIRHDLANRYFGPGDAVGRALTINGHVFEIVGVLPQDYEGPWNGLGSQLWSPVTHTPLLLPNARLSDPGLHFFYQLLGRTPARQSVEPLRTRLQHLLDRMAARDSAQAPSLVPARDGIVITRNAWIMQYYLEPVGRLYRILAGGALLVFAVATVNAGLLLLLRSFRRQHDSTIRLAIGAGRVSLIRMGLMESLTLSLAGGLLAVLLTVWTLGALDGLRLLSRSRPIDTLTMDGSVLLLALGAVVAAGIAAGVAPALFNLKLAAPQLLRSGAVIGGVRSRTATASAIVQIALLTPIVLSASLLLRTMSQIDAIDFGLDTATLYSGEIDLWPHSLEQDRVAAVHRGILDYLRGAGAERSALAWIPDMSGRRASIRVSTRATADSSAHLRIGSNQVSDGYFRTLGIDMTAGRDFTSSEVLPNSAEPAVAIVNRLAAMRLWGTPNVLGRTLHALSPDRTIMVVGVVDDARTVSPLAPPEPFVWEPLGQRGFAILQGVIHVASPSSLHAATTLMQEAVRNVISDLPVHDIASHAQRARGHFTTQVNLSRTALGLSVASLVLAGTGLFGVIGHSVASRRGELAVRMALGARPRTISKDIFGRVAWIAALGLIVATPGSFVAANALSDQLYDVAMFDPTSLVATVLIVMVMCACAAAIPARRAASVSVIEVLREP